MAFVTRKHLLTTQPPLDWSSVLCRNSRNVRLKRSDPKTTAVQKQHVQPHIQLACAKPRTRTRTADSGLDSGQRTGQRTADWTADSGLRTAASTLIETRHSESLITVWTAQRHVPCWAHLPFMKGQDDTIIVRRLQAVCVGVVSVRLVLN